MPCSKLIAAAGRIVVAAALLAVAACGGGGGGGTSAGTGGATTPAAPAAPALTNFASLVVDDGPAALATGPNGYRSDDVAFVSVTLCVPGTTTCQTIDHVAVDTGSVGLRILQSALSPALQAGLPAQLDAQSNPVGECFGFVDGYTFGSVRQADFQVGGEKVAGLALHVVADGGRFAAVPAACSAGGGNNLTTVQGLGSNGILGIGVTATDCGASCAAAGSTAAAVYYDCPAAGCGNVIARAALTAAPFEQLPNPVAAMAVDNNGTVFSLPSLPSGGAASVTGTLYFGIGTQTNNGLGAATVLTTSPSGLLTVVYKAQSLTQSYIDSGSNAYFFTDSGIAQCTGTTIAGFYCPATPLTLAPVIEGRNGLSAAPGLPLYNARTLFQTGFAALPGIGADPTANDNFTATPRSFDLGLPFFFGRTVFIAIAGRPAGGSIGPFFAF